MFFYFANSKPFFHPNVFFFLFHKTDCYFIFFFNSCTTLLSLWLSLQPTLSFQSRFYRTIYNTRTTDEVGISRSSQWTHSVAVGSPNSLSLLRLLQQQDLLLPSAYSRVPCHSHPLRRRCPSPCRILLHWTNREYQREPCVTTHVTYGWVCWWMLLQHSVRRVRTSRRRRCGVLQRSCGLPASSQLAGAPNPTGSRKKKRERKTERRTGKQIERNEDQRRQQKKTKEKDYLVAHKGNRYLIACVFINVIQPPLYILKGAVLRHVVYYQSA